MNTPWALLVGLIIGMVIITLAVNQEPGRYPEDYDRYENCGRARC